MTDVLNASDRLASELTSALIDVNKFNSTVRQRVLSLLKLLEEELVAELAKADLGGIVKDSTRRRRTEALLQDVRGIITGGYNKAGQKMKGELRELAPIIQDTVVKTLNTIITVNIAKPTLTLNELRRLADDTHIMGAPAKEWWAKQAGDTQVAFAREVRMGIMKGETNDELIQRIRGKATGRTIGIEMKDGSIKRVREFAGGIMQARTRDAETLVRTAVQAVSNATLFDTYRGNRDIMRGMGALTTLDNRTSPICIARTGAAWDMDGKALPESTVQESFPGPPPWHRRCRTTMYPITKSWDDLIADAGGKRLDLLDTVPDSTRASMDGLVSGKIKSFDDWVKLKGDDFARQKLGPGRFDLWKEGKLTTSQLIDSAGHQIPLKTLRENLGLAEKAAGAPLKEVTFNKEGKDTLEQWSDGKGHWTPERLKLHNEIVQKVFEGAEPQTHPTFSMMGGGPASGKSTALKTKDIVLPDNHVSINPDDIKEMLPEYLAMKKAGDLDAARFSHEESSYIAKRIMREASERRFNVVLDGTGDGGLDSILFKTDSMRARGFRVSANYVTVDTDVALERNIIRSQKDGRLVPSEWVQGIHEAISEVLPLALSKNAFDDFALWDTNTPHKVKLVASLKDGKLVIADDDLWERFLAKSSIHIPVLPSASDAWIESVKKTHAEFLSHESGGLNLVADVNHLTIPEAQAKIEGNLREYMDGSDIYIRRKYESVDKILESARFKTQFEVGRSGGTFDPEKRAALEKALFDTPLNEDPLRRPTYGYIAGAPKVPGAKFYDDALDQYGSVAFKLKDKIRDRTTFTYGDSYDATRIGKLTELSPSPMNKPSAYSVSISNIDAWKEIFAGKNLGQRVGYLEAQMMGGISLSDVEEVIFLELGPTKEMEDTLRRLGIKWRLADDAPKLAFPLKKIEPK